MSRFLCVFLSCLFFILIQTGVVCFDMVVVLLVLFFVMEVDVGPGTDGVQDGSGYVYQLCVPCEVVLCFAALLVVVEPKSVYWLVEITKC